MAKECLELKVKFTKIGNMIKYTLPVRMYCEDMKHEIPNSMTLEKTDGVIITWLGRNVDSLFKKSNTIFRKVNLSQVYDSCDKPKSL